ncbi:MAG: ATP-dependent metallopeptidase FtsH/Yme1/Tma family protein [Chloroflexi bacterium]|nr:ATP-dependent metallopeptidase FtsH/Yme1/Tma family protein [Chloroflexota bacterium]
MSLRTWLILMAATAIINIIFYLPRAEPRAELPYSAFLVEVRSGNVDRIDVRGQEVRGALRSPITWPPAGAAPAATPAGATRPTPSPTPASYSAFRTTLLPFDDPELVPLLRQQGVEVRAELTTTPWFIELLFQALPLVLLLGVMVLAGRRMAQAQGGVFGFGQSRARLYTAERPNVTFADVAGQDQAKRELSEVVDFLKNPERYRKLGARIPTGALLTGPPGTGKTLLARAVAGEAQVPFFSISGSEFVEMFVGVGASRVRDLFAKAKATAPALIFMDEIDAIGRRRGVGLAGTHEEREQTLNQLLVEMDGFDVRTSVILLAATNRPDVLDPALLRPGRFDRQIAVELPDRDGRLGILGIHTRGIPLAPDVELGKLARATPGFSGADLANLANEAALAASRRRAEHVAMVDFESALDRLVLGAERPSLIDPAERHTVAYHEAGHALVALLTPGADPVHKVTIMPRGRALGATAQLPEADRHNYGRRYLLGRLAVLLGGRVAEEIAIGEVTTGAEQDLREGNRLARAMVTRWGMSDAMGLMTVAQRADPFTSLAEGEAEPSDATASAVDAEVRRLLDSCHTAVRQLVEAHRTELDALAQALLREETLDETRIAELVGRQPTQTQPAP